jgi:predicted dehydrogenase
MNDLRFGLVGCGKIAKRHANLLGKDEIAGAALHAVCDLDRERADTFAAEHGVKAYYNPKEMAQDEEIDVLSILTPSGFHADNVIELARFGKPIVVEKPMALRLSDADRVIEACDQFGVKLFVVKQNRFNAPIIQLRKALDEGRFGKLVLGTVRLRWCRPQAYYDEAPWRGSWQHDGGVLTNQASHHIDLLAWIMGEVDSVFAKASRALAEIEAEDTAVVTLKFRNGALGIIEATTATRPKDLEGSLSILGAKGSVVVGGFAANELVTWQFAEPVAEDETVFEQHGSNPNHPYGFAHKCYYEHVVDCITNDKRQLVDGLGGRKSLELISAIYESIETGREIPLRFSPNRCRLGQPSDNA